MAAYISDIIDGNGGRNSLAGWEFTRIFIVSGLSGSGYQMIVEAKATLNAAGIDIGSVHPEVNTGNGYDYDSLLRDMDFESISHNQIRATAHYREYNAEYSYSLGGTAKDVETRYYYDDTDSYTAKIMTLKYTWPTTYKNPDFAKLGEDTQVHTASILKPRPTIQISRFEMYSLPADSVGSGLPLTGNILIDRQIKYIGKTNASGWNMRPYDAASKWLCLDISGTKSADQIAWRVDYTFQYDELLWESEAFFIDPNTGKPPEDAVFGTGYGYFNMYVPANFSLLELT